MKTSKKGIQVSLRYKLALPVWIFVFLILFILTHTTIRLIRGFVVNAYEARILSEVETFSESIKLDLLLQNFPTLQSHLDWLADRGDVRGARITDREGMTILKSKPHPDLINLPPVDKHTVGVEEISPTLYVASVSLGTDVEELGKLDVFFASRSVERTVREIYRGRILFSFLAGFAIAVATATWTWVTISPLFRLRKTVFDILRGHTEARAKIHTGDEIEELADAFNEMVTRLQQSLKNLRTRSEALEESEERYRALVENASDVIWLLSPEGQIIFVNQGFPGLSQEALLREGLTHFLAFLTEDSVRKFEQAFQEVKKGKTPAFHLTTIYRDPKTEGEIYYSTNLTPVLARDGELKAIQAVTRDVTELKRIELMKDRLIRDVAHELRTPVAKFDMTLNWLEKELQKLEKDNRYQEVLDLMHRNANLLMKNIAEIMDLSRLEAGTKRAVLKPCDLNEILTHVCNDLEPMVKEKGIVLERKLNPDSLPFEGDEGMLYRLFANLITNSIKFTSEGKITVSSSKNQKSIHATVSDTGIGLEKEDLEKIFDRFFQKTPATPGMGVGLALAEEIAALHNGRIWAESGGIGKGSRFIVEFPV